MSWVCPNCSNPNDETQSKCFVCGMERPATIVVERPATSVEEDGEEGKIVFSDFEAFSESIKNFFRTRPSKKEAAGSVGVRPHIEPKPRSDKKAKASKEEKTIKSTFVKSSFAKPWPEHKIKFDISTIKGKGYVRSERQCLGEVNGYCFYKEDGSSHFLRVETVLIQKMAHRI